MNTKTQSVVEFGPEVKHGAGCTGCPDESHYVLGLHNHRGTIEIHLCLVCALALYRQLHQQLQ